MVGVGWGSYNEGGRRVKRCEGRREREEKLEEERCSGTKNCLNSHCRVIMSCHKVSVIYIVTGC